MTDDLAVRAPPMSDTVRAWAERKAFIICRLRSAGHGHGLRTRSVVSAGDDQLLRPGVHRLRMMRFMIVCQRPWSGFLRIHLPHLLVSAHPHRRRGFAGRFESKPVGAADRQGGRVGSWCFAEPAPVPEGSGAAPHTRSVCQGDVLHAARQYQNGMSSSMPPDSNAGALDAAGRSSLPLRGPENPLSPPSPSPRPPSMVRVELKPCRTTSVE